MGDHAFCYKQPTSWADVVIKRILAMGKRAQLILLHGISPALVAEPIQFIKHTIGREYHVDVLETPAGMISNAMGDITIMFENVENISEPFMKAIDICVVFTPVNGKWGVAHKAYTQCVSCRDTGSGVQVANFQ